MGFDSLSWDLFTPAAYGGPSAAKVGTGDISAALIAATAGVEVIAFDSTMLLEPALGLMEKALWGNGSTTASSKTIRQAAGRIKRVFLSVVADQALSIYQRHLAANDATWRAFADSAGASPTVVPANTPTLFTMPLFGDDHQCSIKAAVQPTFVALSIRLSSDQAIAE